MAAEPRYILLLLGTLAALFAWSVWAGLAALALAAGWILSLVVRDALARRKSQQRCSARIAEVLAAQGLGLDAIFHSDLGVKAIGLVGGRMFVVTTPEEAEVLSCDAVLEASARRLMQGDYEIGFSVPGRVSGKPYWHGILVRSKDEARRWLRTVGPVLGARAKAAELP
jgi:hypothetical protein